MCKPNFYITSENYNKLIGPGFWAIQDLPSDRAEQVRSFLNNSDSFAVFASGEAPHLIQSSHTGYIGGIDWVRLESSRLSGEPPLNVYHYGIGQEDERGFPVYGPYRDGTVAPHWSELDDLDVY